MENSNRPHLQNNSRMNNNLQQLQNISCYSEAIIDSILEFEPRCEQFVSRFVETRSNAAEITTFKLEARNFLHMLNALNREFYKHFQPIPVQHPWFQANEWHILSIFADIARLHHLLVNLLETIAEKESYGESPAKSKSPPESKSSPKRKSAAKTQSPEKPFENPETNESHAKK